MYIAVFYIIIVLGLAALAGVFWIDRNWFKRYMKEVNGRVQLAKIRRWEAVYLQRPTVYELWIEVVENGEKRERLLPCRERTLCLPRKRTGRSRMCRRGL